MKINLDIVDPDVQQVQIKRDNPESLLQKFVLCLCFV